jgi:hypothetical protein
MWTELSEAEWSAHPLNRARGWIGFLVWLDIFVVVITPAIMTYSLSETSDGTTADFLILGRPVWLQMLDPSITYAVSLTFLWTVWTRWRYAPELNVALILATSCITIVEELIYPDPDFEGDPEFLLVYLVSFGFGALLNILIVLYLFLGARPNVMFRRRVRVKI